VVIRLIDHHKEYLMTSVLDHRTLHFNSEAEMHLRELANLVCLVDNIFLLAIHKIMVHVDF
jgi:hypothetical protein